ncbi:MAG: hypothetical protein IPK75_00770 [Acidobacteria bacterium]|jgi:hypothetical protein|nr:hypothetical protein [Acidobacteriota bacterium]
MKVRTVLASLFITSFGAAPALAQVCDPPFDPYAGYEVVVLPPAASYPPTAYGNPCAPYAWCGPRDAWGRPVYAVPGYSAYPAPPARELVVPQVNGWTGAVEMRPLSSADILVAY